MKHVFQIIPLEPNTVPSDKFYRELQQSVERTHKGNFAPEYKAVLARLQAGEQVELAGRTFKLEEQNG